MKSFDISPLKPRQHSATDRVFNALYDAVISIKLPPGSKVSEAEIAAQLDVSRQPVRDAFYRLANLGFLSIRPQRATLITQISEPAIHSAVFIRVALESECLHFAMKHNSDKLIKALQANLAKQERAMDGEISKFHTLDESFHEQICHCAMQPNIWNLIREQKAHLDRIRFLTLSDKRRHEVLSEHQEFFDAICRGNVEQAEQTLRDHISAVATELPRIRAELPDYFDTQVR